MFSKKKGDISQYALIRIAEVVIGLSMIVLLYVTMSGLIYGTCWQNTIQDLKKIQSEASLLTQQKPSKNVFIEFGTCTDVVIFSNRDKFDEMVSKLGGKVEAKFHCFPDEFRSIIASIKKSDKAPSFFGVIGGFASADKKPLEDWVRSFIVEESPAECISLKCANCTFSDSLIIPITEKSTKYCISMERKSDTSYYIAANQVKNSNECVSSTQIT